MPLAVYAAVKLDILEIMPLSQTINSGAIADQLSLNAEYTYRLMRAVCAAGILMEKSHDQFSITEKGCLLRSDGQPSLRNSVLLEVGPVHVRSWTHLSNVIKNGPPVNGVKEEYGCDTFVGLLESNAEYAQVFNGAMTSYSNVIYSF
jgi:predicted transcriptional regulator